MAEVMQELELLREVVGYVIRDRAETLDAFNDMDPRIEVEDETVRNFLQSAERVLGKAKGRATQMVFGTLWKKMYPDTPLKELVRASFRFAPSAARILQTSERFVVTTDAGGRSVFWLRERYDQEHPPLPPSDSPPPHHLVDGGEQGHGAKSSRLGQMEEEEVLFNAKAVNEEEQEVAVEGDSDEEADPELDLIEGEEEEVMITETRAWREVFDEIEFLREDLWRFKLGLPLGQDRGRGEEIVEEDLSTPDDEN
jgi:hypothetical protein